MIVSSDLTLPAEAAYIPLVRHLAVWLLKEMKVVEPDVKDVELVVGEVCNNVVLHAYEVPGCKYSVRLDFHLDKAVIMVTDQGAGLQAENLPKPEGLQVGGYGLWLVRNIADKVKFERPEGAPGTQVQAELRLHYESEEAREHAGKMESPPTNEQIRIGD